MSQGFAADMADDDAEFDKLREESRQEVPPAPEPGRTSSPDPAKAQTPPSTEELVEAKRVVPEAVFLEEKSERKRLEKLLTEQAERLTRTEERHRIWEERFQQARQPAPPPAPDKAQDPVGYLEHQIEQTRQQVQPVQQLEQRLNNWEQFQRVKYYVDTAETEFAAKTPDYYNAMDRIREARLAQYKLQGLNEQQQQQQLGHDTWAFAVSMMQQGRNPAEAVYELARAYGYSGSAPADATAATGDAGAAPAQPRNSDGTFAKQPPDPKVERKKEALKTVARGQEAAKSIGDAAGEAADAGIPDLDELSRMDDEAFDKWTSGKNWRKFWN